MASESGSSSVLTGILLSGTLIAGAGAIYLFVNQSNLTTAEQNTLAQAEGLLPPPARLPTLAQPVQQTGLPAQPGELAQPATSQPGQAASGSEPASAAPVVTRLRPVAPKKGGSGEDYDDDGGMVYEPEDWPENKCPPGVETKGCFGPQ